ncbi:hypothetical protein B0H16DRAFT_1699065 [Mycena metata]|uniref:Uncharacterized protein n=1 Tax=Mycena metata TaxID=1033252 RepID=A0AAD7HMC8_9AGAR|nr:hypothetical protein B0H16DRAFT_1699065 [Mycena metata]
MEQKPQLPGSHAMTGLNESLPAQSTGKSAGLGQFQPDISVVISQDKGSPAAESNEPISTAVLVKLEIQLEDIESLEAELPNGGAISSVHSPHSALAWVETHYDDILLKSMRTRGLGGPITAMLSPETVLDDWVLAAAKLLSNTSNLIVIIRPLSDDPSPKWLEAEEDGSWDTADSSQDINSAAPNTEDALEMFEDAIDSESGVDARSVDSRNSSTDSDPEDLDLGTGVFRLRGGASTSDGRYIPWLSPMHNLDIHLTIQTSSGVPHNVKILSKIQSAMGTDTRLFRGQSYQLFLKRRQYFQIGHTAVLGFMSMDSISPDARIYPVMVLSALITQTKTVNTETRLKAFTATVKAGPSPTGEITPKWIVECEPGHEFKNKDDYYEELNFSYMSTSDKTLGQNPLKVEFSAGINVGDRNNTRNTDLPPVAFITRNQTMLWLSNGSLKSKGIGIIILTSAYISEIQTLDELYLVEYPTVQLNRDSTISMTLLILSAFYLCETEIPPTDRAFPTQPGNPLALSIGILPDRAEPGFLKQILNRVTKSPRVHKGGPLAADIETLPLYEFTSRGWDATRNEWRMPIYPSLSHCLRQAVKNSTLRTWNLKVVGLDLDTITKGKQRNPGQIVQPMDKDKDVNTTLEEPKAALPFVGSSDKVDLVHDEFGKLWLDLDGKVMCARNCKGIHLRLSSNAMFKPKSRLEPLADGKQNTEEKQNKIKTRSDTPKTRHPSSSQLVIFDAHHIEKRKANSTMKGLPEKETFMCTHTSSEEDASTAAVKREGKKCWSMHRTRWRKSLPHPPPLRLVPVAKHTIGVASPPCGRSTHSRKPPSTSTITIGGAEMCSARELVPIPVCIPIVRCTSPAHHTRPRRDKAPAVQALHVPRNRAGRNHPARKNDPIPVPLDARMTSSRQTSPPQVRKTPLQVRQGMENAKSRTERKIRVDEESRAQVRASEGVGGTRSRRMQEGKGKRQHHVLLARRPRHYIARRRGDHKTRPATTSTSELGARLIKKRSTRTTPKVASTVDAPSPHIPHPALEEYPRVHIDRLFRHTPPRHGPRSPLPRAKAKAKKSSRTPYAPTPVLAHTAPPTPLLHRASTLVGIQAFPAHVAVPFDVLEGSSASGNREGRSAPPAHPSTPSAPTSTPLIPSPSSHPPPLAQKKSPNPLTSSPIKNLVSIITVLLARARRTSSSEETTSGGEGVKRNGRDSARARSRGGGHACQSAQTRVGKGSEEGEGEKEGGGSDGNAGTRTCVKLGRAARRYRREMPTPTRPRATQVGRKDGVPAGVRAPPRHRRLGVRKQDGNGHECNADEGGVEGGREAQGKWGEESAECDVDAGGRKRRCITALTRTGRRMKLHTNATQGGEGRG